MKDAGLGNKIVCKLFDPVPGDPILLAASLQRSPPQVGDVVPERLECPTVCRDRMIFKEASYDAAIFPVRGLADAYVVAFPP
jgi:hypothetical protein